MTKALPKDLTSYDLLKTLAVVLMIVDHIGVYFFPEEQWWRIIGRMSAPIWLFLIGYARTRAIPVKLWGGALILTVASVFVAPHLLPLTILFGMIFARRYLDKAAGYMFSGFEPAVFSLIALALFMIPSHAVVEYGLLCLLIPIYGYMRRVPEKFSAMSSHSRFGFIVLTCATYIVINGAYNDLSIVQLIALSGGVGGVFAGLYFFKPQNFSGLTKALPRPVTALLKFGGRRTLEIYIGHLILFKALAFALGIEGFGLFEWALF